MENLGEKPGLRRSSNGPVHERGNPKAAVTLLEYSDFECSFSGEALEVIEELLRSFGSRLKFRFRNFPLTALHPHALDAARTAEAAGRQGRFWEMHDLLFRNQDKLTRHDLFRYAEQARLDLQRFKRDLADMSLDDSIRADIRAGEQQGVSRTPTFFINEKRYSGPTEFESLRAAIERDFDEYITRVAI